MGINPTVGMRLNGVTESRNTLPALGPAVNIMPTLLPSGMMRIATGNGVVAWMMDRFRFAASIST